MPAATTRNFDPGRVATLLEEVAAEAILPRFKKLAQSDIKPKGDQGDFATIADLEAERGLTARLTMLLPGSLVVGEEAHEAHPERLEAIGGEAPVWIIDPLDGTHNFADGLAQFCIIVALARASETIAAWIHDPVGGATVAAERGSGAWEGTCRLHVADPAQVTAMRGAIYAKAGRPGVSERLDDAKRRFAATPYRRCAGHEYLALARATQHFAMFSRLYPWDHAAGILLHREAGGYNACWDGAPYRPTRRSGGILLAPDRATWATLAALLLAPG